MDPSPTTSTVGGYSPEVVTSPGVCEREKHMRKMGRTGRKTALPGVLWGILWTLWYLLLPSQAVMDKLRVGKFLFLQSAFFSFFFSYIHIFFITSLSFIPFLFYSLRRSFKEMSLLRWTFGCNVQFVCLLSM